MNQRKSDNLEKSSVEPVLEEGRIAQRAARRMERRAKAKEETIDNAFTRSLDALKAEDLKKQPRRKRHRRGFTVTQWIALGLCALVFIYAGVEVSETLFEYAEGQRQYDELRAIFYADTSADDYLPEPWPAVGAADWETSKQLAALQDEENPFASAAQSELDFQVILARLSKLKSLNADTYGWIKITGTDVDYPVMQGADNNFYLRRSFYKTPLNSGSIFVDSACSSPDENYNTVIYGHNMKDGTMFHSLFNLENESYFNSAEIRLMTPNGVYVYEVYSVHRPHETEQFFHTEFNPASYAEFVAWTKEQSLMDNSAISVTSSDKIITLSTCVSTTNEEPYRFVVHGVLRAIVTS